MSRTLDEVMLYLDCPRKYSLAKAGAVKEMSDNDKTKSKVKEGIKEYIASNISLEKFKEIIGSELITHGKTTVKVEAIYNLVKDNIDKLNDTSYILTVALKMPTGGYEKSLYYNIHQVVNCENKELKFNVIILNVTPKLEQIVLPPRNEDQALEIKLMVNSVDRLINMVEKEQLVYIKRPNNITCSSCVYNSECKPICFTRESKEVKNV